MSPSRVSSQTLEAVALSVLDELGRPEAPIDSLVLALALGIRLEATPAPRAMLAGNAVMVSPKLAPGTLRWCAAHEIGHWILKQRGIPNSEAAANRVAEALVLPMYAFDPEAAGWHVGALQKIHSFCSLETIARRIATLRHANLTIWRRGRAVRRHDAKGASRGVLRVTTFEHALAGAAHALGGIVTAGPRMVGFVDDANVDRVVTLCAPDQLQQRLAYARSAGWPVTDV